MPTRAPSCCVSSITSERRSWRWGRWTVRCGAHARLLFPVNPCAQWSTNCCCFSPCSAANSIREPIYISYIPSHLYHMLFELFKVINSAVSSITVSAVKAVQRHFFILKKPQEGCRTAAPLSLGTKLKPPNGKKKKVIKHADVGNCCNLVPRGRVKQPNHICYLLTS